MKVTGSMISVKVLGTNDTQAEIGTEAILKTGKLMESVFINGNQVRSMTENGRTE